MKREEAIKLIEHISIAFVPTDQYGDYDDPLPYEEALGMAIEALSADRPTGEWKGYNADNPDWLRKDGTPIFLVCDKCHGMVLNNSSTNWNYCPNCGARMEGGDDE